MTTADKTFSNNLCQNKPFTIFTPFFPLIFSRSCLIHLLLLLSLVLLSAVIKQLLVHLHKELKSIVDKPVDCPAGENTALLLQSTERSFLQVLIHHKKDVLMEKTDCDSTQSVKV